MPGLKTHAWGKTLWFHPLQYTRYVVSIVAYITLKWQIDIRWWHTLDQNDNWRRRAQLSRDLSPSSSYFYLGVLRQVIVLCSPFSIYQNLPELPLNLLIKAMHAFSTMAVKDRLNHDDVTEVILSLLLKALMSLHASTWFYSIAAAVTSPTKYWQTSILNNDFLRCKTRPAHWN
jgi:hypothetical protein